MRAPYILRGAPGSGKSTWIEQNGYAPLSMCPDEIRLTELGIDFEVEANRVKARSYEKFFNLGEHPETTLDALSTKLQFPVDLYLKEDGYLGICASNGDGTLFAASKGSMDGEFAKRVAVRLEEHLGERQAEFSDYLDTNDFSAVFEVVEPQDDPHIVAYDEPRLVLLALVRNTIRFEQLPYPELCEIANRFGLECKQLLATVNTFEEFCTWVDNLKDEDWMLNGEHIEGFVAEDAAGYMVKVKGQWYRKWKSVRGVLRDVAHRGRSSKVEKLRRYYDDADSIYEAAKEYGAAHSKRQKQRKGLCPPAKAENVILFRDWYEEEYLRKQTIQEISAQENSVYDIKLNRVVNYMREYPCGLISGEHLLEEELEQSGLSYIKLRDKADSSKGMFCVVDNRFPAKSFEKLMCHWCTMFNQETVLVTGPADRLEARAHAAGRLRNGAGETVGPLIKKVTTQDIEAYFQNALGSDVKLANVATVHAKYFRQLYCVSGMQIGDQEFKKMYPGLGDKKGEKIYKSAGDSMPLRKP